MTTGILRTSRRLLAASFALAVAFGALPAGAGLFEEIERLKDEDDEGGRAEGEGEAPAEPAPAAAQGEPPAAQPAEAEEDDLTLWGRTILTSPRKKKLIDPRFEPQLLVRALYITTEQERFQYLDEFGEEVDLNSMSMDPSIFGHREGFVIENAEFGLKGRFNGSGLYYGGKFEMVPREKDGNRSSDYLKDAYLGWDRFNFFDVEIGRMKIPLSQVNNRSTSKMAMIYAPTLNTLTPKRQLGAKMGLGDPWQVLRLEGGFYNSASQAIEQLARSDQLMKVGRAELRIHKVVEAFGVAPDDMLDFRLQLGINVAGTDEMYDPPTKHRWVGYDAHLHLWVFTVEGEIVDKNYFIENIDENGETVLLAEYGWGWHLDVIAAVWPEVVELAFRVEEMDGDKQERGLNTSLTISELKLQRKQWITAGINFYPFERVKLSFNYLHRRELEGYTFDNDAWMWLAQFDL